MTMLKNHPLSNALVVRSCWDYRCHVQPIVVTPVAT